MDAVNPLFRIERTIILVCYSALTICFISHNLIRMLSNKKKYFQRLSFISFLNVKFTSNFFGILASILYCALNIDAHGVFKMYSTETQYILKDLAFFFMMQNFICFAMLSLILEKLSEKKNIEFCFKLFLSVLHLLYLLMACSIETFGLLTKNKFILSVLNKIFGFRYYRLLYQWNAWLFCAFCASVYLRVYMFRKKYFLLYASFKKYRLTNNNHLIETYEFFEKWVYYLCCNSIFFIFSVIPIVIFSLVFKSL